MDTPEITEPHFTLFAANTVTSSMDGTSKGATTVYRQETFLKQSVYGETATFSGGF